MSDLRPITPGGYDRYSDELQRLWHEERPRIVQEVSDAAAMGDRSENAEYIYGKKRLREIDRRMRYLSQLLDKVTVIDPKEQKSDRVIFGATVVVEDEDGKQKVYQIVGEDESDVKKGRISLRSPVGKALMNKKAGDNALVHRPAGELELLVVEFRYE